MRAIAGKSGVARHGKRQTAKGLLRPTDACADLIAASITHVQILLILQGLTQLAVTRCTLSSRDVGAHTLRQGMAQGRTGQHAFFAECVGLRHRRLQGQDGRVEDLAIEPNGTRTVRRGGQNPHVQGCLGVQ